MQSCFAGGVIGSFVQSVDRLAAAHLGQPENRDEKGDFDPGPDTIAGCLQYRTYLENCPAGAGWWKWLGRMRVKRLRPVGQGL